MPDDKKHTYSVYANLNYSDSNDVELRRLHNMTIDTTHNSTPPVITEDYPLTADDYDLNTTYTGIATVNLHLNTTTTRQPLLPYTPQNNQYVIPRLFFTLKDTPIVPGKPFLTGGTQGCWLHSYFDDKASNQTECYVYYTQHKQNVFTNNPQAEFHLTAPTYIGANKDSSYTLQPMSTDIITLKPYDGHSNQPEKTPIDLNYQPSLSPASQQRSLLILIDPQSDPACRNDQVTVDQVTNSLSVGDLTQISLPFSDPVTGTPITLNASDTNTECIPAFFSSSNGDQMSKTSIYPGIRPITVIKLLHQPQP